MEIYQSNDDCNIERCTANENFSIIPNEILQHPTMSAIATMVLVYLLSCKAAWVIKPKNVWKAKNISRDQVYAAFNELIELGYMQRTTIKLGNIKSSVTYKVSYLNKFLRRPDIRDTEPRDTENQDALIRNISKKNDLEKRNNNPPTAAAPQKEPSAPVATSSVAPTAVVVSSFLEDLEIRNSLKIKLTKTYTEDQIKKAVDCLSEMNPDNLEAALQAALKEGWEPKGTPEDQVEKNQEFLETIRSADGKKHGPYRVEIGPQYIHFRHSCIDGSKDIHYNVEDKGFLVAVQDIISQHKT